MHGSRRQPVYGTASVYGKTREIVHGKWLNLHNAAKAGPVPTSTPSLAQYLNYWLDEIIKPNSVPLTYETYAVFVRLYQAESLGGSASIGFKHVTSRPGSRRTPGEPTAATGARHAVPTRHEDRDVRGHLADAGYLHHGAATSEVRSDDSRAARRSCLAGLQTDLHDPVRDTDRAAQLQPLLPCPLREGRRAADPGARCAAHVRNLRGPGRAPTRGDADPATRADRGHDGDLHRGVVTGDAGGAEGGSATAWHDLDR